MKERAFTLIELLAVIVILAIIALIATPIVLGIINDARENSKKRSAELVYTGVEYAYTDALFKEGNGNVVDDVKLSDIKKYLKIENLANNEDNGVTLVTENDEEKELRIQTKDNVYCKVVKNTTTKTFDVSCGTDETYEDTTNVMGVKSIAYDVNNTTAQSGPQYYGFISSGNIGDNLEDLGVSTNPPSGKNFYLGFDSEDGETISAAYVCFISSSDGEEYCLKGHDSNAYNKNQKIIKSAFPEYNFAICSIFDEDNEDYLPPCYFDDNYTSIDTDTVGISVSPRNVEVGDGEGWSCYITPLADFACGPV